jgi:hypothetical protein
MTATLDIHRQQLADAEARRLVLCGALGRAVGRLELAMDDADPDAAPSCRFDGRSGAALLLADRADALLDRLRVAWRTNDSALVRSVLAAHAGRLDAAIRDVRRAVAAVQDADDEAEAIRGFLRTEDARVALVLA